MRQQLRILVLFLAATGAGLCEDRWTEYGEFAAKVEPIPPTPIGEGHIGQVASGNYVQLRFPAPKEPAAGYWLGLGNIVPFTGKGTSYQLVLRRDSQDGPVIHEGMQITDPFAWGPENRNPMDITDKLTEADRARGYIDIFVTAKVEGDGWTIYRHNPNRPVLAQVAVLSPDLRQKIESAKALQRRGVSIIPIPKQMKFSEGTLNITGETRIVLAPKAPEALAFAAQELKALLVERSSLRLEIVQAQQPQPGDILLRVQAHTDARKESYELSVDSSGVRVSGADELGCFYGAMTVAQIAQRTEGAASLPYCAITDWPSFPLRYIQYDIARGQTVNVEYVKRMIRELARFKMNGLMFYMEDDFRFRKYPFLGREDTFTHEKALALSAFAKPYHVQLIPQFEALGHAGAVLGHPEMKDLREAGGAWVFCTSEPRTWQFLDDVFGELVQAFPDTQYLHVGADEFESGFGKCPRCLAKIAKGGVGALYAQHMNGLNHIVKKYGKVMLFWPSHGGPTPDLSFMTVKYQDKLEKDCIPTEWIYHGPSAYPEIEEYQKLGFKDVHCCPSVVDYFFLHPIHDMTFRAIRGFYRAGEERRCGGVCCTTWGFMHGALVENSWYGLVFAAECSWSPATTARPEFDRRFADLWWGITGGDIVQRMDDTIYEPITGKGKAGTWRNRDLIVKILWAPPETLGRQFILKQPTVAENVGLLLADMDRALEHVESLSGRANRNQITLRATKLAFRLMRYAGEKLSAFQQASALYREAAGLLPADAPACAQKLAQAAALLPPLQKQASELAQEYRFFVENCGAYKNDFERLQKQSEQYADLAGRVADLAQRAKTGAIAKLPPGDDFGLPCATYTKLGEWNPSQMRERDVLLTFDAGKLIAAAGEIQVEWEYQRGGYGINILRTALLCKGKTISEDAHPGWAGAGQRRNAYKLQLKEYDPKARYEIVGEIGCPGGTDSLGVVWLVRQ